MHRTVNGTAVVLGALALGALAVGCGSSESGNSAGDEGSSAREASARGVISAKAAHKVVDRYERVNNRANTQRDGQLLATVEGGGLLAHSQAQYKQYAYLPKERRTGLNHSFRYVDRELLIPRKGTADWFAVVARTRSAKKGKAENPSFLVFKHAARGWKSAVSTWVKDSEKRRIRFARDAHGFAEPVKAPEDLGPSLAALYSSGGAPAGSGFAKSSTTKWVHDGAVMTKKGLGSRGTVHYAESPNGPRDVFALRTRTGDTYAAFDTTVLENRRTARSNLKLVPAPAFRPYVGRRDAAGFDLTWVHQSAALIPSKGERELLNTEVELTDVDRH